jgi:hypothetical protein
MGRGNKKPTLLPIGKVLNGGGGGAGFISVWRCFLLSQLTNKEMQCYRHLVWTRRLGIPLQCPGQFLNKITCPKCQVQRIKNPALKARAVVCWKGMPYVERWAQVGF